MKRIIIQYNSFILKVNLDHDNTCILDSYKVKDMPDMENILWMIQSESEDSEMAVNKRGVWGMVNEWRVHNLLYSLGIQRDRTRSVDLNINQPWYMRLIYTIISPFYLHFH